MKKLLLLAAVLASSAYGTNNGTVNGTPTFGSSGCKFSNCLTASSDANNITLPTGLLSPMTGNFTFEFQVSTPTTSVQVFYSFASFWLGTQANGHFGGFLPGMGSVDSTISISDGAMHHVAAVFNNSTGLKLFVDGVQGVVVANLIVDPGSTASTLGTFGTVGGFPWLGKVDEAAFWSTAKYTANFTAPTSAYTGAESNLLGLYHLQANGLDSAGSVSPTLACSPATIVKSSTGNATTLTGTSTAWTAGTPGSPTFSVTGGTSPAITAQTISTSTAAALTVNAGSSSGVITFHDPDNSTTCTITVVDPQITIPFSNTSIFVSPNNWFSDGAGAMQSNNARASSTYIRSNTAGAYFKTVFSGSTTAALPIDASVITSGIGPILNWSVDNGAIQTHQISGADTEISLATGLTTSAHTLFVYIQATDWLVDRWTGPVQSIKLSGLKLDPAGAVAAPSGAVALGARRMIFYGDSITEGFDNLGGANGVVGSDAYKAWPAIVADAFNAEYGQVGFSAQGWTVGSSNVPAFPSSWDLYWASTSRLISGKLSPIPDYVLVSMGTNDGADLTTTITTWIGNMRAAVNSNTPIFLVVPPKQNHAAEIPAAIIASGDSRVYTIDLGVEVQYSVPATGVPTRDSLDGTHPTVVFHGRIGGMIARRMQELLGGNGSGAIISFQ